MKTTYKKIAIIFTAVMAASVFTGCGNEKTEADNSGYTENETTAADETAGETEAFSPEISYEDGGQEKAEMAESEDVCAEDSLASESYNEEYAMTDSADCVAPNYPYDPYAEPYMEPYGETYEKPEENSFCRTQSEPLSTFSADVDTASYSNVRRMIQDGYSVDMIPAEAVRPEEFINYFSYDLNLPKNGDKFGITTEISKCPWNAKHDLMMVGMRTEAIDLSETPDSNLVFLLDISGSMDEPDKLPLLKSAFAQLVDELDEKDTVSIVTYADGVDTVLSGAKGSEKDKIKRAIDSLFAGGGTNGEDGIQRAYQQAEKYFIKGGNNRVILATDGDLNIGISTPEELKEFITEKKENGVYLSVLGFGTGNINDANMESLADYGNGNYAYIDSLFEAKKVLVEELGSTLVTVAEDVKLQVEFNPQTVGAYRLIGYENRQMEASEFRDDKKDAGEIGAGHTVVALYELIPAGSEEEISLKYQNREEKPAKTESGYEDEYATVAVRYKEPGESRAKEFSFVADKKFYTERPDDDFKFASAAAELALILSDSSEKADASLEQILETCKSISNLDEYKNEFYFLVKQLAGNGR